MQPNFTTTIEMEYNEPIYPIIKRENFDEDNMKGLLNDQLFSKSDRSRLSDYNKARLSGGRQVVSYKFGAGCEELQVGRLFPEDGRGLQSFRFDMRNPLAKRFYWDLDIDNAHFRIAWKYCDLYQIKKDKLEFYIQNRKFCLNMVSPNRAKAKTEFLKILYGGNIKLYNENYIELDGDISPEGTVFLRELKSEMDTLANKVWEYHPLLRTLKTGKEKTAISKKLNPKASLMSLVFQTDERQLLMYLDWYLQKNKRSMCVFIHDGGYVEKLEGEVEFPTELLQECSLALSRYFQYQIVLTQKEIKYDWEPPTKDKDILYAADDNEASEIIFEKIKDRLISCNGRLFFKHNHVWTYDSQLIDDHIKVYIMNSRIYKKNGETTVSYCQNIKNSINVRDALYPKIRMRNNDTELYLKFHATTKHRLCFQDGVLDLAKHTFTLWQDVNYDLFTCVIIPRTFGEYFKKPDLTKVSEVLTKVFSNFFGPDLDRGLHFLSRAVAGDCEDKNWGTFIGNRNCGKGVLYAALKTAFCDYVQPFEIGNMMYCRKTEGLETVDCSKKLYWLLDLEFVRLAINQESPSAQSGLKANSKMLKKIAGGGDTIIARRNYDRFDTQFTLDATLFSMGNDYLDVDNTDCNEHRVEFRSVAQFKTQGEIDDMKKDPTVSSLEIIRYKVKDPEIKNDCQTIEWANAVIWILMNGYKNFPVHVVQDVTDDDCSLVKAIGSKLVITHMDSDCTLVSDINESLSEYGKQKIMVELAALNVAKKKATTGSLKFKWVYVGIRIRTEV